jgi:AsmA protein
MGSIIKYLAIMIGAVLALVIVAGIAVSLFFDPNDFRDQIQEGVKESTGRDLVIEGDIELDIFPWLALDVGKASLGNAEGFGDEPMARFDRATLSVKLLPMLLSREVSIGTANLESLHLNLAVDRNGRSNWEDLAKADEEPAPADESADGEDTTLSLNVTSINISNASFVYADARTGDRYSISNANLKTGNITEGTGVSVEGGLSFDMQPKNMSGDVEVESNVMFDPDAGTMAFDNLQISGFVEGVMETPVTFGIKTNVDVGDAAVALNDIVLALDESVFRGAMKVPRGADGVFEVDLVADTLDLNRYMVPADAEQAAATEAAVPVAIPNDLVRALNARGTLKVGSVTLGGLQFENVDLGMNTSNGKMRLYPISADIFDGSYKGDVRLNASGSTAVLAVDETIKGVSLKSLAGAMFEEQNISGTISGNFKLTGRGNDTAQIQKTLNGTMTMGVLDGAWEGVDLWYELRRARALLKKEAAPEPSDNPRTEFSSLSATGVVTNGIFKNDDFRAEMPFMQVDGRGSVNIPEATVDYRMSARVLNKPELAGNASAEELEDLTKTVIPIRISGPLSDPSIKPDVEDMLKQRVEEEVKDKLKDKLKDIFGR